VELSLIGFFFYALIDIGLSSQDIVIWVICFYLINSFFEVFILFTQSEGDYKLIWMLVVAVFPVFGLVLYLMFANKRVTPRQKRRLVQMMKALHLEASNPDTRKRLHETNIDGERISKYIEHCTGAGVYENTKVTYYPLGDVAFPAMLEEIKKAKHYIFLEYFIISPGKMWNAILEVLEQKVLEGVDIRLIYDDFGNLGCLPAHYDLYLQKKGIKARAFMPIVPFLTVKMNNRDHRKILVVDGHTGFTGGINLADEYINEVKRFGVWKDNVIKLVGKGVYSLTLMFLSNWKASFEKDFNIDVYYYSPSTFIKDVGGFPQNDGFVQPYGDLPFDYEAVGQGVYLSILSRATKYVYIATPYLIEDEEMRNTLRNCALSGVDVRLLVPHIPDKKSVFRLTQSNYGPLLDAGVKIYEYTPGFVHQKMFVSDDTIGTVGTINLDYRSLYLHMENAVLLANTSCLIDMKNDFLNTLKESQEVTLNDYTKLKHRFAFFWALLKIVAPLL
jgi:cardiolipin synthase